MDAPKLRYLAGIVDLPYITPAGRLVTKPGWDSETCLYLHRTHTEDEPLIPESPDADAVRAALVTMVEPFRAYRFATRDDAAGMVSAIFAAVGRPLLGLCPAYLFDAAQQGSGKTLAATALGAIIEGHRVGVTPFAGSSTDDELRKRLVAGAIDGTRFHCIDNVVGFFRSATLAATLTSGRLTDRVLGQSRMVTARVRSLLTMTANNASIDADLQRRTVQVRIDAGSRPTHRAFDFDPVTAALAQRRRIADAVCTVQRAWFAAGAPTIVRGDAGGFSDWNVLCRQPILWVAREGLTDGLPFGPIGDPAASMLADASASDPDLEATGDLIRALWALTDGKPFTAGEALQWFSGAGLHDDDAAGLLRSAVVECAGRQEVSARALGRVLMYRRDRVIGGLKIVASSGGRVVTWRVLAVE